MKISIDELTRRGVSLSVRETKEVQDVDLRNIAILPLNGAQSLCEDKGRDLPMFLPLASTPLDVQAS